MSKPPSPQLNTPAEKLQALQYLYDLAASASAPARVHEQAKEYAVALQNALFPPAPVLPGVAAGHTSVAEAIKAARARLEKQVQPAGNTDPATEVAKPAESEPQAT